MAITFHGTYNRKPLTELAERSGLETVRVTTDFSPVNWTYSLRNVLDDWGAPRWLVNFCSLTSVPVLVIMTLLDLLHTLFGRGSIQRGTFVRKRELSHLLRFKYRPMVFVNVKLSGPSNLPDVVTWTPEQTFPFFRVSDIGRGMPWLVPAGKSLVTCDIGCEIGDDTWKADDEELGRICIEGLEQLAPGTKPRYLGCRVMRVPLAYPVFRVDYEGQRRKFESDTGIEGLYSIGRNGEFRHLLMEDVYWRSRRKMLPIVDAFNASREAGSPPR